jgi:hypothetical protein
MVMDDTDSEGAVAGTVRDRVHGDGIDGQGADESSARARRRVAVGRDGVDRVGSGRERGGER